MGQGAAGRRARLVRRLESYWKLEAMNVALVPALAALAVVQPGDRLSWPLALAMLACSLLLAVGAVAWKLELDGILRRPGLAALALPWLARLRTPSLLLALASLPAAVLEYRWDGGWTPSAIATTVLAVLSVLEWVNYYAVQLQHFDHAADFRRLLQGRGFRRAHLARAVDQWRRR